MHRRKVLLIAAVLIAALGATMVFLYVRSADDRAAQGFVTVDVLRATVPIEPGELIDDAFAAQKMSLESVPTDLLLPGYQDSIAGLSGQVALTTIYPGELIIGAKFGQSSSVPSSLQIPRGKIAISVNLTDPARVAGFVTPGSNVAVFLNAVGEADGQPYTRMLLGPVSVLGVGSTTPVSTTTTDETGASTTEQLPSTLLTLAVDQGEAERVLYAQGNGELAFALLTDNSTIAPGPPVTAADLFQS